jgi:hypothetical protein
LVLFSASYACAPVQHHETIQQPLGVRLSADKGSSLFHIDRTSYLPTTFEETDLFDEKVDGGTIDLIFAGMAPSGEIRFQLVEIFTRSNRTMMRQQSRAHAMTDTSYPETTSSELSHESTFGLPPKTTEFLFDPKSGPLVIRGMEVVILGSWPDRCDYTLRDLRPPVRR